MVSSNILRITVSSHLTEDSSWYSKISSRADPTLATSVIQRLPRTQYQHTAPARIMFTTDAMSQSSATTTVVQGKPNRPQPLRLLRDPGVHGQPDC
jgi:uncharacterized protein (DUF924 family)